jgi:hypothetical protein
VLAATPASNSAVMKKVMLRPREEFSASAPEICLLIFIFSSCFASRPLS